MLTGRGPRRDLYAGRSLGADAHLIKPIDPEHIARKLRGSSLAAAAAASSQPEHTNVRWSVPGGGRHRSLDASTSGALELALAGCEC